MLALVVGGWDGLDNAKSTLATRSLILLVVEQIRIVIFLLAKEVVLLVGIEVPVVRRRNYICARCVVFSGIYLFQPIWSVF